MEAVIFCGVQATGKSTFYKERFFRTHLRINLDMLKTRHRESILLGACIEAEQSFVVDNTNPTREERARYIEAAKAGGFKVTGYYFQSQIQDALARNATRSGAERIPEKGLRAAHARLELPGFDEGFETLFYVKIGEGGGFVVEAWAE